MDRITLGNIVSEQPVTVGTDRTVQEVLEWMAEYSLSSLVIADRSNRPLGIFTERDALRMVHRSVPSDTPIKEVMTRSPLCLGADVFLHDAYRVLEENKIRHLVVVDADRILIGVVSEGDFLRHMGMEHLGLNKTVHEVMNESVLLVTAENTLAEAASLMGEHHSDYVVVMEEDEILGVMTERDIARLYARNTAQSDRIATHLSRSGFSIVHKNFLLQEAAVEIQKHNIHQLIVIDDAGRLAGALTRHSVLMELHGAYYRFLLAVIEQKSTTIERMEELERQLIAEKEQIIENELKWRKLFEALPEGIVVLHAETMVAVEFNRTAHEQLGYSAEEFADLKVSDYEAIESMEETRRRVKAIMESGSDSFETVHRKKDGILINVWVNTVLMQLKETFYIIAVFRDITDRKQVEEELDRKSSFLRTLVNTIPDLIWMKDIQGTYLACNPMFERFFGAKESAIVGKSDFDFVAPELARFFLEHDTIAIRSGGPMSNEEFLKFADGSYEGYFETVKTPMKDEEGNATGVLGVARDITDRKKKEAEINRVQALAHIGTWEWDLNKDQIIGSAESYRIMGVPHNTVISIGDVMNLVYIDDRQWFEREITKAFWDGVFDMTFRIQGADQDIRWVKINAEFQSDESGRQVKGIGIVQDMTERMRYEEELKRKDDDLQAAQALAQIGSWRLDIPGDVLEWSDETYRIFGIEIGTSLSYESFLSVVHPDDQEKVNQAWELALTGEPYEVEHRILVNGSTEWVRENARLEVDDVGNLLSGVGTVQVITERKLYEAKLEKMANFDTLTMLANRSLMLASLKQSIDKASRQQSQVALLIFDLDRFKDVNDSFGHSAGDELLIKTASRFSKRFREGDMIARLGGDEFAVILEHLNQPQDAGRIAEEMIRILSEPYKLQNGVEVHLGASAGIVVYPQDGEEADMLLQHVDTALYKAKSEGRGTYHYYTEDLTEKTRKRLECENHLRRAIDNNELEVFYQPQVHIETGRIVGAEALVRWNDPQRGRVSPVEFIPIAEETGLIREIGEWVLNAACIQGKEWLDKGHRLTVAVNLSPNQIRNQDVRGMVEYALRRSGFPAARLELEITESALMQREEEVVSLLHGLRALGIRLAIDDFGTGYSSLSYLKRFPIDILKIDKSFVDDLPFEQDDMAIVSAIIAMAQALGYQVLAEETERIEQIEFLQSKGCMMYQGYFKSPPLPAAEFEKLLE